MLNIFSLFISHLYVFRYMSAWFFCPLFDWVLHFSGIELHELLYILEINSLSVVLFAIIFSHFEGSLFTLLIVSFVMQKLLSLIRSHFVFISVPLGSRHRGSCCDLCH